MSALAAPLIAGTSFTPLSLLSVGLGLVGGMQQSAAINAQSRAQQQQLQAQAAAAQYNQQIAEQNAKTVEGQTQAQVDLADKQRRLRAGQAIASAGASGVGIESFNDVLNSSAMEEELNLLTIKNEGMLKANQYRQQGTLYGMSAQGALDQIPYVKSAASTSKAANILSSVSKGINSF